MAPRYCWPLRLLCFRSSHRVRRLDRRRAVFGDRADLEALRPMVLAFAARACPEAHAKGSDREDRDGLAAHAKGLDREDRDGPAAHHVKALGHSDRSAGI